MRELGGAGRLGSAIDAILAPLEPCELAESGKVGVKIGTISNSLWERETTNAG